MNVNCLTNFPTHFHNQSTAKPSTGLLLMATHLLFTIETRKLPISRIQIILFSENIKMKLF